MKIAIVDRNTNKAVSAYVSNKIEQRTNQFGGPWDDPNLFEHVKIPQSLESEPLENLQAYNGQECCGHRMVQIGTELAFDQNDQPILDSQGNQTSIPKYEQQEIFESKRLMRIRP